MYKFFTRLWFLLSLWAFWYVASSHGWNTAEIGLAFSIASTFYLYAVELPRLKSWLRHLVG